MSKKARLKVAINGGSRFLSDSMPIEVRDSSNTLVRTITSGQSTQLQPGLYDISTTLDDGRLHRQVVHFSPGQKIDLSFGNSEPMLRVTLPEVAGTHIQTISTVFDSGLTLGPQFRRIQYFRNPQRPEKFLVPQPARDLRIVSVDGAQCVDPSAASLRFIPQGKLTSVPKATLDLGGKIVTVSLPVNPKDSYPRNSCVVDADASGSRALVSFAPERTVASAIQGMARSGEIVNGLEVADKASTLLLWKYSDPVAAAFGGLLLYRVGRLSERRDWVENLARDFAWLPDGRVLLAAILSRSKSVADRTRGNMLLAAAAKWFMFSDGYSLLLNLLRRWPDEAKVRLRFKLLGALAGRTSMVDWGSATFSTTPREYEGDLMRLSQSDDLSRAEPGSEAMVLFGKRRRSDPSSEDPSSDPSAQA